MKAGSGDEQSISMDPILGIRIGKSYLGAFLSLEYGISSFTQELNNNSEVKTEQGELSLVAGYDLPAIPLKIFGKYFIDQTWQYDTEISNEEVTIEDSGQGFGVGIGITAFPMAHINFEINSYKLNNSSIVSGNSNLSTTADNQVIEYMLNLSIPFGL